MKERKKERNVIAPRHDGEKGLLGIRGKAQLEAGTYGRGQSGHDPELGHVRRGGRGRGRGEWGTKGSSQEAKRHQESRKPKWLDSVGQVSPALGLASSGRVQSRPARRIQ